MSVPRNGISSTRLPSGAEKLESPEIQLLRNLSAVASSFQRQSAKYMRRFESQAIASSILDDILLRVQQKELNNLKQVIRGRITTLKRKELALEVKQRALAQREQKFSALRKEEHQYVLDLRKQLITEFTEVQHKLDLTHQLEQKLSSLQGNHVIVQQECDRAFRRLYNLRLHIANMAAREKGDKGIGRFMKRFVQTNNYYQQESSVSSSTNSFMSKVPPSPSTKSSSLWPAHIIVASASVTLSLKNLPDSLLLDVFSFLEVQGVTRISMTSRALHMVSNSLFKAPASPTRLGEIVSKQKQQLRQTHGSWHRVRNALSRKDRKLVSDLEQRVQNLHQQLLQRQEESENWRRSAQGKLAESGELRRKVCIYILICICDCTANQRNDNFYLIIVVCT